MKKLFGTDGIRGHAGEFPLDAATVSTIGSSLARQFSERLGRPARFISGRDTRESGALIEAAFHKGAVESGAACLSSGVMTTPGVAYLTKSFDFDAGIVISASHNPFYDNGIKVFLPSGMKIDEGTERAIEDDIHSNNGSASDVELDDVSSDPIYRMSYTMHLSNVADQISKNDLKIVVDCANGAASKFAGRILKRACASVITINDKPDGRNINADCGSLHLDKLRERVLAENADLGVAFDGDADRALFVDEAGNIVDGDATLWIMAQYLKARDQLSKSTVVATVMSNIGLEMALKSIDVNLLRTDVGDKYVLEKLIETGSSIGGEQSGHIIFPDSSLVGDGMMTALLMLRAITDRGVSLSKAAAGFVRFPQTLKNVKVSEKRLFSDVPVIVEAANQIESELGSDGRLLLRYSGTENLARVMIEGKDQAAIESQAERLIDVIKVNLG